MSLGKSLYIWEGQLRISVILEFRTFNWKKDLGVKSQFLFCLQSWALFGLPGFRKVDSPQSQSNLCLTYIWIIEDEYAWSHWKERLHDFFQDTNEYYLGEPY